VRWVSNFPDGQWTIRDWLRLLDTLPPPVDEAELAQVRDAQFQRLFPSQPGAKRSLTLSPGVGLELIFLPTSLLRDEAYAVGLVEGLLRNEARSTVGPPPPGRGVWLTTVPVTVRQFQAATRTAAAGNLQPDLPAKLPWQKVGSQFIPLIQSSLPFETVRLPTRNEVTSLQRLSRPNTTQRAVARKTPAPPKSVLGVLGRVAEGVVKQMADESQEWFFDSDPTLTAILAGSSLPFRLALPV
jgi:hypothetical protein